MKNKRNFFCCGLKHLHNQVIGSRFACMQTVNDNSLALFALSGQYKHNWARDAFFYLHRYVVRELKRAVAYLFQLRRKKQQLLSNNTWNQLSLVHKQQFKVRFFVERKVIYCTNYMLRKFYFSVALRLLSVAARRFSCISSFVFNCFSLFTLLGHHHFWSHV